MLTAHLKPTFFAEWVILAWGQHGDHGVLRLPSEPAATLLSPGSTSRM